MISRRFFAAFLISLSRLLFLFEILAIWDFSFEIAWQQSSSQALVVNWNDFFEGAVKLDVDRW
jgi:hypothetical protein